MVAAVEKSCTTLVYTITPSTNETKNLEMKSIPIAKSFFNKAHQLVSDIQRHRRFSIVTTNSGQLHFVYQVKISPAAGETFP